MKLILDHVIKLKIAMGVDVVKETNKIPGTVKLIALIGVKMIINF